MVSNETLDSVFLTEEAFVRRLHLEQRRAERSWRALVLVLLEVGRLLEAGQKLAVGERIAEVLATSIRETNVRGSYEKRSAIGVIFTEVDGGDGASIGNALVTKVHHLLSSKLTTHRVGQITLSFYVFPEDWDKGSKNGSEQELDKVPNWRGFRELAFRGNFDARSPARRRSWLRQPR